MSIADHPVTAFAPNRASAVPGRLTAADVRLRYADDAVELEVSNTGRAPISGRAGLGLVGMRERAASSGGTLEARARDRGGFLVRARMPLTQAVPA